MFKKLFSVMLFSLNVYCSQAMLSEECSVMRSSNHDGILLMGRSDDFVDLEAAQFDQKYWFDFKSRCDLQKLKRAIAGLVIIGAAVTSNFLSPDTTGTTILTARVGKYLKPGMKDMRSLVRIAIGIGALGTGYGIEYHLLPANGIERKFGLTLMGLLYFCKAIDMFVKKLGTRNED